MKAIDNALHRSSERSKHMGTLDDQLRARIADLEKRMHDAVTVRIEIQIDKERTLGFGKIDGAWCFFIVDEELETKLSSCDRETRGEVFVDGHVQRLIESAPDAIDAMIKEREHALAIASEIINALEGST